MLHACLMLVLLMSLLWGRGQDGGAVVAWGGNSQGQTDVPEGLSNVVTLSANSYYTLAVKSNGTVVAWGRYPCSAYTNIFPPQGWSNVVMVSAGANHSLALKDDGTVMAWGSSDNGQTVVPPGLTNIVAVTATHYNSYALRNDGTVVAWGNNVNGSTDMPTGLSNVVGVAGGIGRGLALKIDGTVVFWGNAGIPFRLSDIVAIEDSMALKADGTVVSWTNGAAAGLAHVVDIAAAEGHGVALNEEGTVVSWGAVTNGPAGSKFVGVAAGWTHGAAIASGGSPVIFRQPFVSQTVSNATKVLLNVGAAGRPPLNYQWRHNGTNLVGANGATLILSHVGGADIGLYDVLVTNMQGSAVSRAAFLNVSDYLPAVSRQPASQTGVAGGSAVFEIEATGCQPLYFQWRFNGAEIAGATNRILTLTNLQSSNAGAYDVWVANATGSTVSSNAILTVLDCPAALNTTGFVWQTSGDVPWFVSTASSQDGVAAMQTGDVLGSGQQSVLQTTATGPGTLTYWWRLTGGDLPEPVSLTLLVDGIVQLQLTNTTEWGRQTCYLGSGSHELQWIYTNASMTSGVRSGGLDLVEFSPGGIAPVLVTSPGSQSIVLGANAIFNVTAAGTPPFWYQWQCNNIPIPGATNSVLALTNVQPSSSGAYSVVISNEFGITTSPDAVLSVMDFPAALDSSNLTWQTSGDVPWFVTTASSIAGAASVQTGDVLAGSQQSVLQTTVTGPGTLAFWWHLNESYSSASLRFLDNGLTQSALSDWCGWQMQTVYLGPGIHVLQWVYTNTYPSAGWNYGRLDNVSFVPGGTAPIIAAGPVSLKRGEGTNVTFSVTANGTPPLQYQWLYNGNTIANATNAALILTNVLIANSGAYSVLVSNAFGITGSAWVTLTVTSTPPTILTQPVAVQTWPKSSVMMAVNARGSMPLNYQWRLNGTGIPGATNPVLPLDNVQFSDSGGIYSVVVSNVVGSKTSSNAMLRVSQVVPWGAGTTNTGSTPNNGQSVIPPGLSNVQAVAAGWYHSLALLPDGRVRAWGSGSWGLTNVPSNLTNAAGISAGQYHSLVLRSNGTVSAWGNNNYGIVTSAPASATNLSLIAAGWYHNLALRSNGTVVAWGSGTYQGTFPYCGQCMVPTNLTAMMVAAGGCHSLALRSNGTVVAWGWNAAGQTNVPAGLSNVVAIAAGGSNSIALKNDGTLVVWGSNSHGQTNLPDGLGNVVAIAAGAAHNLALKSDGTLVAWGLNGNGQTNIPTGLSNINSIAAGSLHSLATVNVGPVAFLSMPYGQTVFLGSNVLFTPAFLGEAPLSCQWLHNGTNVIDGTNASLAIPHAMLSDSGNYQMVVSNGFGAVTSAVAVLTVHDIAPFFTLQPTNRSVLQYSNATLVADVGGIPPFHYQWMLNGMVIPGATNPSISITNVQLANEGSYTVLARNIHGSAVSSNVFLNVIDVPEALGPVDWRWFNPGLPVWVAESTNTHDGFAAVSTGVLTNGNQTRLETFVTGPGMLTFWWSGWGSVFMAFQIDGVQQTRQQISSGWRQCTYYLPSKTHVLTWTAMNSYAYNGSLVYTSMGFLDQVVFTPGVTPARITSQPASRTLAAGTNTTLSVAAVGTPPMTYQWRFNGVVIPGATQSSLTLNDIQADDAGAYTVVVDNGTTPVISSNAVLTVTPSMPVITTHPVGGTMLAGSAPALTCGAIGTRPISYQWLLNDQPVTGATNTSLTLSNVQPANAGVYSLLASNEVGMTVSSNAVVVVYDTAGLAAVVGTASNNWDTLNVPWFPQTNTTHDGVSAAQSGVISSSQQSTLQATVTGPARVTFWWKVTCDSFWSSLAFAVNGTIQTSITGSTDWQAVTNDIGSGTRVLQWNLYPVHGAFADGTGWVDQVEITPIPVIAAAITAGPVDSTVSAGNAATLSVTATGTPTLFYQWMFNGAILPAATNATLTLNNVQNGSAGTYSVLVSNDAGFVISSNATLVVNPSVPVITRHPATQTNLLHGSAVFSVTARGSQPLSYHWRFNGTPIPGATGSQLTLANLQLTNAGRYTVVVSNQYGTLNSAVASLTLIRSKVTDCWPYGTTGPAAPAGLSNLVAIAAGAQHTMVLRADGTVVVWGVNMYGQTNVPAGLSNVLAIAAGNNHCLALKKDGTVMAWGDDGYGQGSIPAGLSNVVSIAAGPTYNLALRHDGTVMGWGNSNNGQTDVPAGLTNAQAIFAGYYNGFARMADGSLIQWGEGPVWSHNGTNTQLRVGTDLNNAWAVAAGAFSGWALCDNSLALAYGWYDGIAPFSNGYLGYGMTSPGVHDRNIYPGIVAMAAFGSGNPLDDYVILLDSAGQVTQAGGTHGFIGISSTVPDVPSGLVDVVGIAAGYRHAAVLANDGSPWISQPLMNRNALCGSTVTFLAGATGRMPMFYQWQFNGSDLVGATNAVLVLTNIPLSAAGTYRCVASNAIGVATSLDATLTVLRTTPRFDGAAFVSENGFGWQLNQLSGHGHIVIQASTNLVDWAPVFTNPPVSGTLRFLHPGSTNQSRLFYRALEQ
jgi:alpha-tubulin suppressor-like RCC1 family protein